MLVQELKICIQNISLKPIEENKEIHKLSQYLQTQGFIYFQLVVIRPVKHYRIMD